MQRQNTSQQVVEEDLSRFKTRLRLIGMAAFLTLSTLSLTAFSPVTAAAHDHGPFRFTCDPEENEEGCNYFQAPLPTKQLDIGDPQGQVPQLSRPEYDCVEGELKEGQIPDARQPEEPLGTPLSLWGRYAVSISIIEVVDPYKEAGWRLKSWYIWGKALIPHGIPFRDEVQYLEKPVMKTLNPPVVSYSTPADQWEDSWRIPNELPVLPPPKNTLYATLITRRPPPLPPAFPNPMSHVVVTKKGRNIVCPLTADWPVSRLGLELKQNPR